MSDITLYTYNILESGTVTVTGTPDTGYPESRLYDRAVSFFWKDTVTEAKTFHVDQGASNILDVDFLAIEGHNFSGQDMQWQYSTDDFAADINDAVTDWTQADNEQIVKTLSPAMNKRYWRVTVTSMTNPLCGEIFMGAGRTFEVKAKPSPVRFERDNVQWNRTIGGLERSTKFGPVRRGWEYHFYLDSTDLASFQAAMDDLDDYLKPFYLKDHTGTYMLVRLLAEPEEDYSNPNYTRVMIRVIEML